MRKAAFLLFTAITLAGLCGCGKTDAGGSVTDSMTESLSVEENYFGGEGELKAFDGGYDFYDNDSVYSTFGELTLKKYNKKTNTLYVVCDDPDCEHIHHDELCKANTDYCVFNGDLINVFNDRIYKSDGTVEFQGYLYLCGGSGKKEVYKNENPAFVDPERDNYIGFTFALGDDYLVLINSGYICVLDADYRIKYTFPGRGRVFLADNVIYYDDDLFRLQRLDMESGESSPVELGGMKFWDGFFDGSLLWFSNGEELCSCDLRTGGVKVRAEHALMLKDLGKYVVFQDRVGGREGIYLFDKESGEASYWSDEYLNFNFIDGVYYDYDRESGELTLYEDDLKTVIKSCTLSE